MVPDFAHAVTTYAISDLMGIPEADREKLLALIGASPTSIEGEPAHKIGPDPLVFLEERFTAYLEERETAPGKDLMSDLAQSRYKDGSKPARAELARLARFLFGAGQDTTSRLIAMAVLILAEDPALQHRLRAEPKKVPDFLEEVFALRGAGETRLSIGAVLDRSWKYGCAGRHCDECGALRCQSRSAAFCKPGHFRHRPAEPGGKSGLQPWSAWLPGCPAGAHGSAYRDQPAACANYGHPDFGSGARARKRSCVSV